MNPCREAYEKWRAEKDFTSHLDIPIAWQLAWDAATQEAIKVAQKYGALNVELELRGKSDDQ